MRLKEKKEIPEIPTASMADIAFLLIVFFMLTTVFSANKGMEHILPPSDEEKDTVEPEDSIYIYVFPGGQFSMDQTTYAIENVEKVYEYVDSKIQNNPQKPIIVHCNREANYGDMAAILDQLKLLSARNEHDLAITIPSKDEVALYEPYLNR